MTRSKRLPSAAIRSSRAAACGTVRGNPSIMKPGTQSGWMTRLRTLPIMMSSETYLPAARMGCAWRPRSVSAAISARSMSPVAMCGMPKCERSMLACVPFPLPGAPYRRRFMLKPLSLGPLPDGERRQEETSFDEGDSCFKPLSLGPLPDGERRQEETSFDEAAVLAHHQLRLQLFHRVESHANDDQDRRAAQVHLLLIDAGDLRRRYRQDDRDEAKEDRAHERDTVHHRLQIVRGRTSRADSRDEA